MPICEDELDGESIQAAGYSPGSGRLPSKPVAAFVPQGTTGCDPIWDADRWTDDRPASEECAKPAIENETVNWERRDSPLTMTFKKSRFSIILLSLSLLVQTLGMAEPMNVDEVKKAYGEPLMVRKVNDEMWLYYAGSEGPNYVFKTKDGAVIKINVTYRKRPLIAIGANIKLLVPWPSDVKSAGKSMDEWLQQIEWHTSWKDLTQAERRTVLDHIQTVAAEFEREEAWLSRDSEFIRELSAAGSKPGDSVPGVIDVLKLLREHRAELLNGRFPVLDSK